MIESILTFLTELLKFIGHPFKSRKAGDEITKTALIYDEMRAVVQNPEICVHRFLIIVAHNGGSNIKSYTPTFCSVIHEEIRPPLAQIRARYQKLPMDLEYIKVLTQVYADKQLDLNVTNMPAGILRDIYITEGVKYARVFFLKHDKKHLWFCTVSTTDDDQDLSDPWISVPIIMAVNTIKNIINS